jgi:dissimilatory sulfite reductase (desulfoviridin) alpha/beta subunit
MKPSKQLRERSPSPCVTCSFAVPSRAVARLRHVPRLHCFIAEYRPHAFVLSEALHEKLGASVDPLTIHWSGYPAGCGNHKVADLGLRGFETKIDGNFVDAVAVLVGGRTGPHAVAGKEILAAVPCDAAFPEVITNVIQSWRAENEHRPQPAFRALDFISASTVGLASWRPSSPVASSLGAV